MSDDPNTKRFEVALQTRNFEIDLFWKRSLFFWGFISAAFVGYAALRQSELRIVFACFGLVCSCAWSLVNRGSKYWQECWETKLARFEFPVTGSLFAMWEAPQDKGCWLSGRKYSVSKLAIALSDYVFLMWLAVVIGEALHPAIPACVQQWLKIPFEEAFILFSLVYVVLVIVFCKTTKPGSTEAAQS
jgi:hypothetical protein